MADAEPVPIDLAQLLADVELHFKSDRVFWLSREKIHPYGADLLDELQARVTAAIEELCGTASSPEAASYLEWQQRRGMLPDMLQDYFTKDDGYSRADTIICLLEAYAKDSDRQKLPMTAEVLRGAAQIIRSSQEFLNQTRARTAAPPPSPVD